MLMAEPATTPTNILWENLDADRKAGAAKGCCLTVFFFILAFFLFTPSFFVAIITFLIGGIAGAILGGFLPIILIAVYTTVLIPMIIYKLVDLERHHTKGAYVNSAMVKFLLFFAGEIFLLPTIVQPLILAVVEGGDLRHAIPSMLSYMGLQFGLFIGLMSFAWMGFWLLQIPLLIVRMLNAKLACTPRSEAMAWANRPFDVPYYQAWYLVVTMIAFSYVTIAPVVTLIGAIYMNQRYWVDKYNICTLFYFDFESKGLTPRKAVSFILICMFFF